jgi:hypothetical protein
MVVVATIVSRDKESQLATEGAVLERGEELGPFGGEELEVGDAHAALIILEHFVRRHAQLF